MNLVHRGADPGSQTSILFESLFTPRHHKATPKLSWLIHGLFPTPPHCKSRGHCSHFSAFFFFLKSKDLKVTDEFFTRKRTWYLTPFGIYG